MIRQGTSALCPRSISLLVEFSKRQITWINCCCCWQRGNKSLGTKCNKALITTKLSELGTAYDEGSRGLRVHIEASIDGARIEIRSVFVAHGAKMTKKGHTRSLYPTESILRSIWLNNAPCGHILNGNDVVHAPTSASPECNEEDCETLIALRVLRIPAHCVESQTRQNLIQSSRCSSPYE